MVKVLVVDDERVQCMTLGMAFQSKEFEVQMATSGTEALETGLRFRPDVLIVDWMLRGSIDGIEVSESLRTALPTIQTIMVTGYSTPDIRDAALKAKIFGFFSKPLEVERLRTGVQKALGTTHLPTNRIVGFIELDRLECMLFASAKAKNLLRLPKDCRGISLEQWLTYRAVVNMRSVRGEWFKLPLRDTKNKHRLCGYAKSTRDGGMLLFVIKEEEQQLQNDPVIRTLIGQRETNDSPPVAESFLIVEPDRLQRRLASANLKSGGLLFHAADSHELAAKIVAADENLGFALLSYSEPESELQALIEKIRETRPAVEIIGISTMYKKREFEAMGVQHFLLKPVLTGSVLEVVQRTRQVTA